MTIKELIEKRLGLVAEMRRVCDESEKREEGKRSLTSDEQTKWDSLDKEVRAIKAEIERRTRMEEIQGELDASIAEGGQRDNGGPTEQREQPGGTREEPQEKREMRVFQKFLRSGFRGIQSQEDAAVITEMNQRTQQMDADTPGGYLVAPEHFVAEIIKDLDNEVHVRSNARIFSVTGSDSLGAPTLDTDAEDGDWTAELGTPAKTEMAFGKRELKPNLLSKRVLASMRLVRNSAIPIDVFVRERLGYKLGVAMEKGFLTGDGAAKPLGVFAASSSGVPTSRDVSTGNTTTDIRFDGLKSAKYSLKSGHRNRARWMFHRNAVERIEKLKNGEGQYLWQPATIQNPEDRILGLPYDESEYAPNTFTTGLYVGLLANWHHYWIADNLQMGIVRLDELYQESNSIGWIGRMETDGMPVLAEAFARVKLA